MANKKRSSRRNNHTGGKVAGGAVLRHDLRKVLRKCFYCVMNMGIYHFPHLPVCS